MPFRQGSIAKSTRTRRLNVLFGAIVIGLLTFTQNIHASAIEADTFELKPIACVADYFGQECKLNVQLIWRISAPTKVCILQDQTPLKCWQGQRSIDTTIPVNLKQNTTFELFDDLNKQVLASQQVSINYVHKYRRRLKPQWSIF